MTPAAQTAFEDLRAALEAALGEADPGPADPEALASEARDLIGELAAIKHLPLSAEDRDRLIALAVNVWTGLGPLEAFVAERDVDAVQMSPQGAVFIRRGGIWMRAGLSVDDPAMRRRLTERALRRAERPGDRAFDATRVAAAEGDESLLLRLSGQGPQTLASWVDAGALSASAAALLRLAWRGGWSLLIAGAAGAGKTALLRALALEARRDERILVSGAPLDVAANTPAATIPSPDPCVSAARALKPDRWLIDDAAPEILPDLAQAAAAGLAAMLLAVPARTPKAALLAFPGGRAAVFEGFDLLVFTERLSGRGPFAVSLYEMGPALAPLCGYRVDGADWAGRPRRTAEPVRSVSATLRRKARRAGLETALGEALAL